MMKMNCSVRILVISITMIVVGLVMTQVALSGNGMARFLSGLSSQVSVTNLVFFLGHAILFSGLFYPLLRRLSVMWLFVLAAVGLVLVVYGYVTARAEQYEPVVFSTGLVMFPGLGLLVYPLVDWLLERRNPNGKYRSVAPLNA